VLHSFGSISLEAKSTAGPQSDARHMAEIGGGRAVVTARSLAEAAGLRDELRSFAYARGKLTPFSDLDALSTIGVGPEDHAEPYAVVYRESGVPYCAIIGRILLGRSICRIGYRAVSTPKLRRFEISYGGLVTDGTLRAEHSVCTHLDKMLADHEVDCITIHGLATRHQTYASLSRLASFRTRFGKHWVYRLPGTSYADVLKGFSRNHRHNIRRKDRGVLDHFKGAVGVRLFCRIEEVTDFMTRTASLAGKTYQAALGLGFSDSIKWHRILETEARLGRLRCYWLVCGGEPVAFQVGVVYGDTYFLHAMGYLPEYGELSLGTVLHLRVLSDLMTIGVKEVDYEFGDSEFKRTYGSDSWDEATLHLCGHSRRTRRCRLVHRCAVLASIVKSTVLQPLGLDRKLKRVLRHLRVARQP